MVLTSHSARFKLPWITERSVATCLSLTTSFATKNNSTCSKYVEILSFPGLNASMCPIVTILVASCYVDNNIILYNLPQLYDHIQKEIMAYYYKESGATPKQPLYYCLLDTIQRQLRMRTIYSISIHHRNEDQNKYYAIWIAVCSHCPYFLHKFALSCFFTTLCAILYVVTNCSIRVSWSFTRAHTKNYKGAGLQPSLLPLELLHLCYKLEETI